MIRKKSLYALISLALCIINPTSLFSNEITIKIRPKFNSSLLVLNSQEHITLLNDTITITQLKVYISNLKLTYANGQIYNEVNSYHLVNLEHDSTLTWVLNNVPLGTLQSINFDIGIDSASSCSGAMSGDLDPMFGMYWAWNSGYINAKIEGNSSSCLTRNNEFKFHIGGYKENEKTIQNVSLTVHSKTKNNIISLDMNVDQWFDTINLKKENSILIPGKKAVKMAHKYQRMFTISYI